MENVRGRHVAEAVKWWGAQLGSGLVVGPRTTGFGLLWGAEGKDQSSMDLLLFLLPGDPAQGPLAERLWF